jgi:hypothetical protein
LRIAKLSLHASDISIRHHSARAEYGVVCSTVG